MSRELIQRVVSWQLFGSSWDAQLVGGDER